MTSAPAASKTLSRLQSFSLCIFGGVLMALAFLPFDISVLVWVGLLPLLTVLWRRPRSFWGSFGYGWIYGMAYYCTSFWWIHEVSYVFGIPMPVFLGVAFFPLMSYYALFPALWAAIGATYLRPRLSPTPHGESSSPAEEQKTAWKEWAALDTLSTLRSATGLAALWVCIEWLRGHGTLAFSWNSLGMALYDGLSLAQWAEFVGTSALAFLPVFISVIIWCSMRRCILHNKGAGKGVRPWDFYAATLVIFGLLMGGLALSQHYSALQMAQRESCLQLPVVAVQTNLDQKERIGMSAEEKNILFGRYLNATGTAYRQIQKDTVRRAMQSEEIGITQQLPLWVVWPESALAQPLFRNKVTKEYIPDLNELAQEIFINEESGLPALRRMVKEELGGDDFILFTGADEILLDPQPDGRYRIGGMLNSLTIMPGGLDELIGTAKQHLMPFGEYVPFTEQFEWVQQAYSELTGTQAGEGIQRGDRNDPIAIPLAGTDYSIGVIPAICYEDTVGDLLTKFVRTGPQVIVNISNDAWFRYSVCGEQQARSAAFRCIELRRPMVRAANQGLTCSIAPNGAPIDELRLGDGNPWRDGYSYAVLPVDTQAGITLYAMWGDWAVGLCALLALALSIAGYQRKAKQAA